MDTTSWQELRVRALGRWVRLAERAQETPDGRVAHGLVPLDNPSARFVCQVSADALFFQQPDGAPAFAPYTGVQLQDWGFVLTKKFPAGAAIRSTYRYCSRPPEAVGEFKISNDLTQTLSPCRADYNS